MGISSDGQICYGVLLDEEQDYPWNDEKYDNDFECWWLEGVCGYEPPFMLFNAAGMWISAEDEHNDEKVSRYFAHRRAFEKAHPCPVDLENYCSYDYPMYILAVGYGLCAKRGYPTRFDPADLQMLEETHYALLAFCAEHSLKYSGEPCWWLSSLYG